MNYPDLVRKIFSGGNVKYYETLSSGVSMFPTIWPGSELRAEYVPLEDIKKGDIIVFQRKERLVAHRVVIVGDGYVRTQGDSCLMLDEVVNAENYLCKVVSYALLKKITITERSLFWKIQRWVFIRLPWMHKVNGYFVKAIVKVALFFKKK